MKISMVFAKTKHMLKRIVLLTVFLILLAGTCYSHTPIVQWESRSFDYQGLLQHMTSEKLPEWNIILTFDVNQYKFNPDSGALKLKPFREQQFAVVELQKNKCLVLNQKASNGDRNYCFDVSDDLWFNQIGDGFLVVDYIASGPRLDWLCVDSGIHQYYGLATPSFKSGAEDEKHLGSSCLGRYDHPDGLHTMVFPLRKVLLANRAGDGADLRISNTDPGFFGIVRVTLFLAKINEKKAGKIDETTLIEKIYRSIVDRQPETWELDRVKNGLQSGKLNFHMLIRNLLKSKESIELNFSNCSTKSAVTNAFKITLGRIPLPFEEVFFIENFQPPKTDWGLLFLTEKYYSAILDYFNKQEPKSHE